MDGTETPHADRRGTLEAAVAAQFEPDDWAVSGDLSERVEISLPDRMLAVSRRDGPDGADHWTLELAADGATVSKFGPFESVEGLTERVRSLLDGDIRYTVCCGG